MIFPEETAAVAEVALNAVREEIASRSLRRRSTNDDLGEVTVSIGLAQRAPGDTACSLLGKADEALYGAKRAGRNQVMRALAMDAVA